MTQQNTAKESPIPETEIFVHAILNTEWSPLYQQLVSHFCDEMYQALRGRICTPERMALLYPVFREINIELAEIKAETAADQRRCEKRAKRIKKSSGGAK